MWMGKIVTSKQKAFLDRREVNGIREEHVGWFNYNCNVLHVSSVVSDSLQPSGLLCPWDFSGKNTGVGCHLLLQGIFPNQGSNPSLLYLLHCRHTFYHCTTWDTGHSWDSSQLYLLSLEMAMAPQSSALAWKIPRTEEPGGLQSMGSQRVGHDWATSLWLFTFMHWRRKWQPTPVFLPGESQGRGSLVGCRLWGHTESDTTEAT